MIKNKRAILLHGQYLFFPFVLFCITAILPAAGLSKKHNWTIGSSTGVLWGVSREIVYDTSGKKNDNAYLSLLTWDLTPVFTLGANALWDSGKKMSLTLDFHSAIPGVHVGEMSDYDWVYTDMPWSHWSSSQVFLRWGFLFNAVNSWEVASSGPFTLKLGAGYHLDWWAWWDKITDSVYSTSGKVYPKPYGSPGDRFRDRPDTLRTGINGVQYETLYHVPLFSLSISLTWDTFFLNINGRIGPVLAFAHDYHVLRKLDLYDVAFGGPWVDVFVETGFKSSGRFSFLLRCEYAWLNETRGGSLIKENISYSYSRDSAGFAFSRIGVMVLCTWNLNSS